MTGQYCGADAPSDPAATDTCTNPTPILQESPGGPIPTGYVRCESGLVHREQKLDCVFMPNPEPDCLPDDPGNTCASPDECTDAANGYCLPQGQEGTCGCTYGCTNDEECGTGNVCMCNGYTTECVPATCTTDADCGGYQCARNNGGEFACQTPFDACRSDQDCPGEECPSCAPDSAACAWTCQPSEFGCTTAGRPLTVGGHDVRAPVVVRADWRGTAAGSHASAIDRARLAAHWRDAAAMEHASVASFARFALQLMGLGAPPDLLADTALAMLDEIEHARMMFALASADGGLDVGPGLLATEGAITVQADLVAVTTDAMREACIAETLAAVELAEAALHARAPERRAQLQRIADDELRHAALGWRFVKWALDRATGVERAAIVAGMHAAITDAAAQRSAGVDGLLEHGVLDATLANACRRRAIAQVIRPLCAALVGTNSSPVT
jgi:hypothetical protein